MIRSQARRIEELEAENAFLKAQLKIAEEALASTQASKKRKKIDKTGDSNAKLISIEDILHSQQLQDLKEAEDQATKEQRAKKAKTTAKKTQKAAGQAA